jgi:Predicted acyltransferase
VSLRGNGPIDELSVPSGTVVEEHDLLTDGDVLVGGQSTVEFGIRGRTSPSASVSTSEDDIEADGDCRLDTWCSVDGNVLVGEDAYLGERVTITGRLIVSNDLDIGDDVTIEEGFEANGWIVIRNPIPTLVFYFVVLSQLLRAGETDAADELAEALADGDDVRDPLLIPRGAEVSDDAWRVSTPATVGDDCRLHGNLRAESIVVGERDEVFGSLRAREDVLVGGDTTIHGDVTSRGGTVTIEADAHVRGDVSAGDLVVHEGAEIDGSLRARGEMKLVQSLSTEPDAAEARSDEQDGADAESNAAEPTETEPDAESDETPDSDPAAADPATTDPATPDTDAGTDPADIADAEPRPETVAGASAETDLPTDDENVTPEPVDEAAPEIDRVAEKGGDTQDDTDAEEGTDDTDAREGIDDTDAEDDADDAAWDGWPDHDEADLTADNPTSTGGSLRATIEEAEAMERSETVERDAPGDLRDDETDARDAAEDATTDADDTAENGDR